MEVLFLGSNSKQQAVLLLALQHALGDPAENSSCSPSEIRAAVSLERGNLGPDLQSPSGTQINLLDYLLLVPGNSKNPAGYMSSRRLTKQSFFPNCQLFPELPSGAHSHRQ